MSNRHLQGFGSMSEEKRKAAASKGGKARVPKGASVLSPKDRREKARHAAKMRWAKVRLARALNQLESENTNESTQHPSED